MEFVHQPYQPEETIAAVATPPGEGGVAIIRICGKDALKVAAKVYSGPIQHYQSHTVHYGHIKDASGKLIDNVLLIPMLGHKSYAGEDTVEIHCHGGALITRRVLDTILAAGARSALPGEFTFKAFINGKIDLAQAEAVQELIGAKNERALDAAEEQLQGALSHKIESFQKALTDTAAILEAWVDFPEEGLEFATMEELCAQLTLVANEMQQLVDTFHNGRIVHEGIALCLIGSPNVGKSSLMNALLDKERAIVSHIPGTTRDIVEDHLKINGLNIKLIDTAGIRVTEELIEKEGIRRSKQAMEKADLILFVLDASLPIHPEEQQLLNEIPKDKCLIVWNKTDLKIAPHAPLPGYHTVEISAKTKKGLDKLHLKIDQIIWEKGPPSKEELLITNVRHKEALVKAIDASYQVIQGLQKELSPELITMDMRLVLKSLGSIIGKDITEDILSAIFSKFCIGK